MNLLSFIATTWVGHEHRFLGLNWNYLVILGLIGTATFSMRFLVQWWASERQGESVIPVSFWYWSIAGSIIMFLYLVLRRDPVGILAYLPNSIIYIRNLMLIRERKFAFTAERSREMLLLGRSAVHLNFQLSFTKPPLQYWLTAWTLPRIDNREFAVRIWPLIFGSLTGLALAWLAFLLDRNKPWLISLSVALLVSCPLFLTETSHALLD